jgi:hypothetical protein
MNGTRKQNPRERVNLQMLGERWPRPRQSLLNNSVFGERASERTL